MSNRQHFFYIGADPEVFLQDKISGKYKSAVGLIGGTKRKPFVIDSDGNALQEDNVAVEFNTSPSLDCRRFIQMIHKNLDSIKRLLPAHSISTESAWSFDQDELNTPAAQMFGCEPDYNAWTGKRNPKPFAEDMCLRSAGGHIHIGHEIAQTKPEEVIRACDLFLGVPSIKMDKGTLRRSLYGNAGAYRKKPYGVEYRTLSNFWIFTEDTIEWVYSQVAKALLFVDQGYTIHFTHHNIIKEAINTSNHTAMAYIMDNYRQTYE